MASNVTSLVNAERIFFEPKYYPLTIIYLIGAILGLLILCTIVGNVFVVAAILLEKNLQNVSNYLIMSLAVADLLVGALVMPVSALMELSKQWWLGLALCDIWICSDVLLCTSSILHLVAIAIDRYQAVSNAAYLQTRSRRKILAMLAMCWVGAAIISIPARFHFRRHEEWEKLKVNGTCEINDSYTYTIFSNLGAFYLPMIFMLCIYAKIWQTARERIRKNKFHVDKRKPKKRGQVGENGVLPPQKVPLEATVTCGCCYGKYKKIWRANIWTNCHFLTARSRNDNGQAAKQINSNHINSHVTYGAVAAGIRMASAIMSTTKSEITLNNTNQNFEIKASGFKKCKRPISVISSTSSNTSCFGDSNENCVPLSYSILFNFISDKSKSELPKNSTEKDILTRPDFCEDYRYYQATEKEISTLPKSIIFADEDASSQEVSASSSFFQSSDLINSNTVPQLECPNYSLIREIRRSNVGIESTISNNFMTLTTYKKRQKQLKWLQRQHELEKTAIEAMGMIVFDNQSYDSLDDDSLTPRERLDQKRERKAARTLAIITGCFLLCWLPFSLSSFLTPLIGAKSDDAGPGIFPSVILWLGYTNSLLNPIIYTIFAPEFRNAFRKILFGRYRRNK